MPLEVLYDTKKPGKTVTFDFSDTVLSYVVGIAHWRFTFGDDDHHVRQVKLSLNNNNSGKQVTSKISATLKDSSGNEIKTSDSKVTVCCIANVGTTDGNISLQNESSIPNGGVSSPFALPSSTLSIGQAFLDGFNLKYEGNDHHVRDFQIGAGFDAAGTEGKISGIAVMGDDSGNELSAETIDGGAVAASTTESGILANSLVDEQTSDSLTVEFNENITSAVVMLQSAQMSYDSNRHVKTLGAGCTGWSVDKTSVTLDDARAFIKDDSGNSQKDSKSSVSLIVFAIPA